MPGSSVGGSRGSGFGVRDSGFGASSASRTRGRPSTLHDPPATSQFFGIRHPPSSPATAIREDRENLTVTSRNLQAPVTIVRLSLRVCDFQPSVRYPHVERPLW